MSSKFQIKHSSNAALLNQMPIYGNRLETLYAEAFDYFKTAQFKTSVKLI